MERKQKVEKKWFEFQIGLFVEAENKEEAWQKLQPVIDGAFKLDPEGEPVTVLVGEHEID